MEPESQTRGPRACITCAKAKCRCIPGPSEGTCERCHRLNKSCSAQTPAPPRKRKAPKATRVADLERRLEDLTARVGSQSRLHISPGDESSSVENDSVRAQKRVDVGERPAGSQQPASSGSQSTSHNDLPSLWRAGNTHFPFNEFTDDSKETVETPSQSEDRSRPPRFMGQAESPSSAKSDPWYYPVPLQAENLLNEFRTFKAPIFPFVVYQSDITSAQLRSQRPLLWKATMTAGLHMDAVRQMFLGRELLNDIVAAAFLQPRKSFDILQALQILISWHHIIFKSFQMTNLLFLMRSVCVSLGIHESLETPTPHGHSSASLDQMRTYAGVYYLVTMIFTTNKKHDAFMNTSYLAHCCRILEEKMEYPGDQLVVLLVRTQQIAQSICMALAFRNNSLPLTIIVKSFEHEIDQLRASPAAANQKDVGFLMQIKTAEVLLYEAALHEDLAASLALPERLEMLWKCLQACRNMLELRFEQHFTPAVPLPRYTALTSFDYTFVMLTCLQLSTINLPGWDLRLLRKEVDFSEYLSKQRHILKMFADLRREAMANTYTGVDGANDGQEEGDSARRGKLPAGFVDPYETLQLQLAQLGVVVKAELAAPLPSELSRPSKTDPMIPSERAPALVETASSSSSSVGAGLAGPAPDLRDDLDEIMQTFHQSFWQDMDRVDDDGWGLNFHGLMWG